MPWWSSLSRVDRIIASVPAYKPFMPEEVAWEVFRSHWVGELSGDDTHVGVNWSGPRATGYSLTPEEVVRNVEAVRAPPGESSP